MTKHNIWSYSIIGLLFALLFTPLIVSSSFYFPFVTGKVFALRIIASIALILLLILVLKNPKFLPKKSGILAVSGIFILWLVFANFFGVDRQNSFFSNFERMEGWFTHFYLFSYLVVLSSVVKSEKIWNGILNVSVVVANFLALKASFDTESRTQVILGNSTYVAIYVLFNLFFATLLLYRLINKKTREEALKYAGIIYYISSIMLFVYVIFRTQTRGTILALVFSTLLFLILSAFSYWKNKKVRIISIILFVLAILGAVLFWQNRDSQFIKNNPMLNRVASISATEGTGKARLVNWGIAIEGIKERPILGWGQENYSYVFAQKYDPRMYGEEPWFDRTHNSFIDWTIQGGLVALILYILLFASAIWAIKKSTSLDKNEKNILITLLFGYIIHNIFVFDNYSSYLMFFTTLGFVVHHQQKDIFDFNLSEKLKQLIAILIITIIILISIFTIFKPMSVAGALINSLSEKDPIKSLDIYESIFEKNTFGNTEAGIRYLSIARTYLQDENKEVANKYMNNVQKIENMFATTNDVRRLEVYGNFLLQTNNIGESVKILEKARSLAPNRQNNLYTLAFAYLSSNQIDKAKEVLKHAYEVLPENQKAKNYYGAVLMSIGDPSYSQYINGYNYKDPMFLNMFLRAKNYKEVIKIREQMKKDDPTDYQNQVSLAVAYHLNKQNAKAIEIIREVQKAVPEFKAQGDYLIKEIQAGRTIGK